MPIYEFRCVRCGEIQEVLVSNSKSEVKMACKACGGEDLVRVLSRVSYTMGSSGGESPRVTTRTCGPESSCATIDLPGYTR
ncbi:FmdB family zinc ribbon protein [Desulfoglaeba alkanexedens]|uniref:Zinc ribbon domain-containing protein n=1 Tax=Desulfoglaeba alkanexedens ALDC TaxID=980445 RepID=A0A4P8L1L4_9BACT|nr:zinc ribbon domain-containing protein [Desulfoglaeba alkanexedens]QCQ21767.1 zinc ribbon domain-containing protein [Desulfoglaeba alkanexedens ALDC]